MSEWKFRGWDATGQKGWVYGDLVHNKKILKGEPFLADRVMVGGYDVVPESVGICTGAKDRKRKKVFEGDIVRYKHALSGKSGTLYTGFVYYVDGAFVVVGINGAPNLWIYDSHITSIIGNRYEEGIKAKER